MSVVSHCSVMEAPVFFLMMKVLHILPNNIFLFQQVGFSISQKWGWNAVFVLMVMNSVLLSSTLLNGPLNMG